MGFPNYYPTDTHTFHHLAPEAPDIWNGFCSFFLCFGFFLLFCWEGGDFYGGEVVVDGCGEEFDGETAECAKMVKDYDSYQRRLKV